MNILNADPCKRLENNARCRSSISTFSRLLPTWFSLMRLLIEILPRASCFSLPSLNMYLLIYVISTVTVRPITLDAMKYRKINLKNFYPSKSLWPNYWYISAHTKTCLFSCVCARVSIGCYAEVVDNPNIFVACNKFYFLVSLYCI